MNCIYVSEIFRNATKTQILTPFECGNMTKLFLQGGKAAAGILPLYKYRIERLALNIDNA